MSYKAWLDPQALRQMGGIPEEELDELVRVTARFCEDPYNRLYSIAVRNDDPAQRMAELGNSGFVEFTVDEAAQLVRIYPLSGSAYPRDISTRVQTADRALRRAGSRDVLRAILSASDGRFGATLYRIGTGCLSRRLQLAHGPARSGHADEGAPGWARVGRDGVAWAPGTGGLG